MKILLPSIKERFVIASLLMHLHLKMKTINDLLLCVQYYHLNLVPSLIACRFVLEFHL